MKKLLGFVLLVSLLMVGPVLASQITINGVSPGIDLVGQINFKIDDWNTWGYCIEEKANSYIGVPYTGTVRDLPAGESNMLKWASVLYWHYVDHNLAATALAQHKTVDQVAWDIQKTLWNPAFYSYSESNFGLIEADLRNHFKWVDVPNVDGWGQDFLVYTPTNPVPEPATIFLLGCGLIAIAGYGRNKFNK
jgi:hypothetical protein